MTPEKILKESLSYPRSRHSYLKETLFTSTQGTLSCDIYPLSILIDSVFPNYYISIGRFDNENAQNVVGGYACFVGSIPVGAAS